MQHQPHQQQQYGQYQSDPSHQYPQQGAYNQNPPPADPNNPYPQHQQQPGQYGATDPAGAQEGDRGLMGAVAGGLGGHYLGGKAGHGIIGTLAGAFMGSKLEDKYKESHHHGQQGQGGYGQGRW
jgi:hypothetical protein